MCPWDRPAQGVSMSLTAGDGHHLPVTQKEKAGKDNRWMVRFSFNVCAICLHKPFPLLHPPLLSETNISTGRHVTNTTAHYFYLYIPPSFAIMLSI